MEKDTIIKLNRTFEEFAYEQDGVESVSDHFVDVNKTIPVPVTSLPRMATQRKNKLPLHKAILPFKPGSRNCWKNVSS